LPFYYVNSRRESSKSTVCICMSRPKFAVLIFKFSTGADVNHFIAK